MLAIRLHETAHFSLRGVGYGGTAGGSIERWEDKFFRGCFADILTGNWRAHDPYDLENRIHARSSLYRRPNQVSVTQSLQHAPPH